MIDKGGWALSTGIYSFQAFISFFVLLSQNKSTKNFPLKEGMALTFLKKSKQKTFDSSQ